MSKLETAKIILEQLGGNRFAMMTGAKAFVGSANSLSFKIGRNSASINAVHIELTPMDTYTVTFLRLSDRKTGFERKEVKKLSDVYADQLQMIFTDVTGLYTRF